MAKIPIKDAINSGSWFKCEGSFRFEGIELDECLFRIRVNDFIKVNLEEIDAPEKIDPKYDLTSGDFWLLKFEVVNLYKKVRNAAYLRANIFLTDSDDFEFQGSEDYHVFLMSDFAKQSGLSNFFFTPLNPKIKYSGALLFFLPREDNAEYFISINGGEINEV